MKKDRKAYLHRARQKRKNSKNRKYFQHPKKQKIKCRKTLCSNKSSDKKQIIKRKGVIVYPKSLSLLQNIDDCAELYRKIRNSKNEALKRKNKKIFLDISDITSIDFPATMVLSAIGSELASHEICFSGNFPKDEECLDLLIKTGFLNNKVNNKGLKFSKSPSTEFFTVEKGKGRLLIKDIEKICKLVNKVGLYLGITEKAKDNIKSILKEILGNSIEWSESYEKQWTLGIMYEDDRVLFSVLDLGKGIIETIYRRFSTKIIDQLQLRTDKDILERAFEKKYGSSSKEVNRYKGLPSIKRVYSEGDIQNLHVLTNNVMLSFDSYTKGCQFSEERTAFNGTLYYWEINKNKNENIDSK